MIDGQALLQSLRADARGAWALELASERGVLWIARHQDPVASMRAITQGWLQQHADTGRTACLDYAEAWRRIANAAQGIRADHSREWAAASAPHEVAIHYSSAVPSYQTVRHIGYSHATKTVTKHEYAAVGGESVNKAVEEVLSSLQDYTYRAGGNGVISTEIELHVASDADGDAAWVVRAHGTMALLREIGGGP